jgi:MYXO-CTERM domain-containing protein
MTRLPLKHALLAAALTFVPAAAMAQEDVKERAEEISEQANDVQQQAQELANDVATTREEDRNDRADRDGALENTVEGDRDDDGNNGNWGLLGLLGLAGLLGLKKRDSHIHTDNRRDPRL